ncbi:MAG: SEC-C domain-containing protein [Bacteriovorax sp.]|nr:SEC-C domain-containing protein [Bacteriovorax sp.]
MTSTKEIKTTTEEAESTEHVHVHGPNCNHGHHHHHELLKPIVRETPKVGRNDPCSCGSGNKFKKCCGK